MMHHKHEKMDEEKSFEVIPEGVQQSITNPHLVRRGLTEVSAMFDRNGKGYLDETERALRRMDSQDRGFLGVDKVCVIFESLQAEQERSSHLLEALRTESKKSLNLKKGVIALSVFTILLALANVGTSFAISKLVKDTQVSHGDLLVKGTDTRIGTTSKLVVFSMDSLDDTRRRRLTANAGLICESMAETVKDPVTGAVMYTEKECSLQGVINLDVADDLYDQLEVLDRVLLDCNHKKSIIHGTAHLPVGKPGPMMMGNNTYRIFPDATNPNNKYQAMQQVLVPAKPAIQAVPFQAAQPAQQGPPFVPAKAAVAAQPAVPAQPAYNCDANYQLAIYCDTTLVGGKQQECLVMSAYLPTPACPTSPVVCGPKPTTSPMIVF